MDKILISFLYIFSTFNVLSVEAAKQWKRCIFYMILQIKLTVNVK